MRRRIEMKLEAIKSGNWDSSVSVVTRLWDESLRNHGSISGNGKIFFGSSKSADWLWRPPRFLFFGIVGSECVELCCHYTGYFNGRVLRNSM